MAGSPDNGSSRIVAICSSFPFSRVFWSALVGLLIACAASFGVPETYRSSYLLALSAIFSLCVAVIAFEWTKKFSKGKKLIPRGPLVVRSSAIAASIMASVFFAILMIQALPRESNTLTASAPYNFWSNGNLAIIAGWVDEDPTKKTVTPVNLAVYLRVFNDSDIPVTVEGIRVTALADGQWVRLITMADEDEGSNYYGLTKAPKLEGWPLPATMDFGVVTSDPIRARSSASGYAFFAYPQNFKSIEKFKLEILGVRGDETAAILSTLSISATAQNGQTYHGPKDFRRGSPVDLSGYPTVYEKDLVAGAQSAVPAVPINGTSK